MIKRIIYVAFDGTKFRDEEECKKYEKKIRKFDIEDLNIELWNENFDKLTPKNDMDFSDIYFFRCKTVEDFDKLVQVASFYVQCSYPSKKTDLFFYYDERDIFIKKNKNEENINFCYLKAKEFLAEEK